MIAYDIHILLYSHLFHKPLLPKKTRQHSFNIVVVFSNKYCFTISCLKLKCLRYICIKSSLTISATRVHNVVICIFKFNRHREVS